MVSVCSLRMKIYHTARISVMCVGSNILIHKKTSERKFRGFFMSISFVSDKLSGMKLRLVKCFLLLQELLKMLPGDSWLNRPILYGSFQFLICVKHPSILNTTYLPNGQLH